MESPTVLFAQTRLCSENDKDIEKGRPLEAVPFLCLYHSRYYAAAFASASLPLAASAMVVKD